MTSSDNRALVTEVYRGVLGREPDGGGLDHHSAALAEGQPLADLLTGFLRSSEFAERRPQLDGLVQVDRQPALHVDVAASRAQLERLWAHVGATWAVLGEQDPYWSVLSDPRWRMPNMTDAAVLEQFYGSGAHELTRVQAWLGRHGRTLEGTVCAEYGCGVGRLTEWLATCCRHVHGFDISPTHLERARQRLRARNISNVTLHLVRDPADIAPMAGADLFLSSIVLQHNPPPVIRMILDAAFAALGAGGAALFQLPTYGSGYAFRLLEYLDWMSQSPGIEMHCLPQQHVFAAAAAAGAMPLEVQQDALAGPDWASHTFLFGKA